jgi:hypothetical protein
MGRLAPREQPERRLAPYEQPESSGWPTWVGKLPIGALSVGIASTVLIVLRLLLVARFNPTTAYGILQASGTANVIVGTVMSLLPVIAIIAGSSLALIIVFWESHEPNPVAEFTVWVSAVVLVFIIEGYSDHSVEVQANYR